MDSGRSSPEAVLRGVFGYPEFRGHQRAIIEHVLGGGDALVLMPTGGGKSLCFQIPAILRPGVGVVVSPLIALMQDQVEALRQLGVRAAMLNSALSYRDAYITEQQMQRGELDLVYVAPERLLTERFLACLSSSPVSLFAIDEAHCVSQWGHDFRPEYQQLCVLHERFPEVPRLACTATADEQTRRDIIRGLALEHARTYISGFDRPNIRYRVLPKKKDMEQVLAFLRQEHAGDSGIVYCRTRARVEKVAQMLADAGINALPYHAGIDASVRSQHLQRFRNQEDVVMVATIAFGMGIDRPDVRFVVHLDVPKSMEAYYQETGRAGRDGLPADAWMTYGFGDVVQLRQLLARSTADDSVKRIEALRLGALLGFCETATCRRQVLLSYFGEQRDQPCNNCDTCLEPVETWEGTVAAQKALANVYRTGQQFGSGYLADVLLGKSDERMLRFGHEQVTTFGIGGELSRNEWQAIYRQLVAAGFLDVDQEFGSLRLTRRAGDVLRGKQTVQFRRDPVVRRRATTRRAVRVDGATRGGKAAAARALELTEPLQRQIFAALKARRLELAREQAVPPYVVFHDSTLKELAIAQPATPEALRAVSGMGEVKVARYGAAVLEVIAAASGAGGAT